MVAFEEVCDSNGEWTPFIIRHDHSDVIIYCTDTDNIPEQGTKFWIFRDRERRMHMEKMPQAAFGQRRGGRCKLETIAVKFFTSAKGRKKGLWGSGIGMVYSLPTSSCNAWLLQTGPFTVYICCYRECVIGTNWRGVNAVSWYCNNLTIVVIKRENGGTDLFTQ